MEGKNIPSSGPKPNGLLVCPYMSASGAEGERVLPENLNENAETDSHPPGFKPMRMEQELRPGPFYHAASSQRKEAYAGRIRRILLRRLHPKMEITVSDCIR